MASQSHELYPALQAKYKLLHGLVAWVQMDWVWYTPGGFVGDGGIVGGGITGGGV